VHGAGQAVADPDGEAGERRFALLHHVEMGVEGGDLEHFGEREPHLLGQGGEVSGADLTVGVLDAVEMLDQEVAPARRLAEEGADLIERDRIDLASSGRRAAPTAQRALWPGWACDGLLMHRLNSLRRIRPEAMIDDNRAGGMDR
jgi:hypothetical protein